MKCPKGSIKGIHLKDHKAGDVIKIVYKGGIEGESVKLIQKIKDEPKRQLWLYEFLSDHKRRKGWIPK